MKKTIVWILIAFCSTTTVGAQSSASPEQNKVQSFSLSLEQAKQHALDYNRSLKTAGLAVEQAQAAKWAAIANYLPQTDLTANYSNQLGAKLELMGQSISLEPSSTLTFQATQVLFNANVIVGIQLAELSKSMNQNAVQQTVLAVKKNVNTTYYSILVLEDNKRIMEKNLANIRILAKATHDKVTVGIGEQIEADQMDVTVANLENTLQTTERNIEVAYNSMRLLLGIGVNDELKLTEKLQDLTQKSNTFELLAKPFNMESNPEMQMSQLSHQITQKQLQSSYASMLPSLTAVYQHNELLMKSGFDMTVKNTLVLSASVPLFVGGKNAANVKKAKLALQSSQIDLDLAKDQLLTQEKQMRFNLKSAQSSYDIQKKNIEVSQRVFDNITKKYEQGLSSSLELTTANNSLLSAQSNYISAVLSLLDAQDALLKLLGEL